VRASVYHINKIFTASGIAREESERWMKYLKPKISVSVE
jgi:hypothetical protein